MTDANENGLNDTIEKKKKVVVVMLYLFTPSDMNFQALKVILAKMLSQKMYSLRTFLS